MERGVGQDKAPAETSGNLSVRMEMQTAGIGVTKKDLRGKHLKIVILPYVSNILFPSGDNASI